MTFGDLQRKYCAPARRCTTSGGEWYSRSRGASTESSGCERAAFYWLSKLMSEDDLPGAMMIIAEPEVSLSVNAMDRAASSISEDICGKFVA